MYFQVLDLRGFLFFRLEAMNTDSRKIITVLEMLASSLEEAGSISRVRKWIGEESELKEALVKSNTKDPKQVLIDTRRNLLREAKRIEGSL